MFCGFCLFLNFIFFYLKIQDAEYSSSIDELVSKCEEDKEKSQKVISFLEKHIGKMFSIQCYAEL